MSLLVIILTFIKDNIANRADFVWLAKGGGMLGKGDHVVEWTRPERPEWMDEETYQRMPETLCIREVQVHVAAKLHLDHTPRWPPGLHRQRR